MELNDRQRRLLGEIIDRPRKLSRLYNELGLTDDERAVASMDLARMANAGLLVRDRLMEDDDGFKWRALSATAAGVKRYQESQ